MSEEEFEEETRRLVANAFAHSSRLPTNEEIAAEWAGYRPARRRYSEEFLGSIDGWLNWTVAIVRRCVLRRTPVAWKLSHSYAALRSNEPSGPSLSKGPQ